MIETGSLWFLRDNKDMSLSLGKDKDGSFTKGKNYAKVKKTTIFIKRKVSYI